MSVDNLKLASKMFVICCTFSSNSFNMVSGYEIDYIIGPYLCYIRDFLMFMSLYHVWVSTDGNLWRGLALLSI